MHQLNRGEEISSINSCLTDMDREKFLVENFIVNLIFGILFASFESISPALKFIGDHPSVLGELTVSLKLTN